MAYEPQVSVSLVFLPHFDVTYGLLLNGRTATWNLFVLYNEKRYSMSNIIASCLFA